MMIKNKTPGQITTEFFQMCYEADPPAHGHHKIQSIYDPATQSVGAEKKSVWSLTLSNQGRVRAVFRAVS